MNSNKCPVCGNQGIPAYHTEDVICPRCGSDLRIYKTLHEVVGGAEAKAKPEAGANKYKRVILVLSILTIIAVGVSIYLCHDSAGSAQTTATSDHEVRQLKDSVNLLAAELQERDAEIVELKSDLASSIQYTTYVVQPNDSPWRIVTQLYGASNDWRDVAKQIAIDNQIWDDDNDCWKQIHPGQNIKIYIRK